MKNRFAIPLIAAGIVLLICVDSKTTDPYKVLGVDRKATDREIQKAFHKLSLQYHPDKNKNKGAQEKFAEINNAYEILSDEQKRKNYDLYGDEKGSPGFGAGDAGRNGGYSYFTSGGAGENGFNFKPGGWQNMGGQGGSKSFYFTFGGPDSGGGFDMGDIFSNFFGGGGGGGGMGGGSQFGGFGSSGRSKPSSRQQSSKKDNSGESGSKSWSRESAKKDSSASDSIPLLTASNFNDICGDKIPVCIIGVFKSERTREKLEKILKSASQKSFSRRPTSAFGTREQVSYALLDGSKQQSFLTALSNKSDLKSSDKLLLAYKPKRGTYAAASRGEITEEAVESFVSSILNGDVQFSKVRQKPTVK